MSVRSGRGQELPALPCQLAGPGRGGNSLGLQRSCKASGAEENGGEHQACFVYNVGKLTLSPGRRPSLLQSALLESIISVDPSKLLTYFNETLVSHYEYYVALSK